MAAGFAVYATSFQGAFFFDDHTAIRDNRDIGQLWPPWAWQPRGESAVAWRPIAGLSLAINYALGGTRVWGYHAFNVIVHVLAGLVLFGVVRRTLAGPTLRDRYGNQAPWLAMAISLVWLVHPLQTESVTYVVQRTELLMGLFFLLTLYGVIRGHDSPRAGAWYIGAILACALGMGSKEVMVTAPLVVLAYDRVFLSGSFRELFRSRAVVYAGLATTWLPFLYRLLREGDLRSESAGFGLGSVTPWDYARTQVGVIVHYLRLSLWPHPLVVDYYDWPVAKSLRDVAPDAVIILTLLGATVWALRRQPALGFLGVWFFLILAPTSSVLVLLGEFAAERRMYLPLAAVVTLVVICAYEAIERLSARLAVRSPSAKAAEAILLVTAVLALGYATVRRNEDYRSEASILLDLVSKRPDNARAHSNVGAALFRQRRLAEALHHFSEAVRLKPDYPQARNNLGAVLLEQGRLAEASAQFAEALRLKPDYADAHANMGAVLQRSGHTEEAIPQYTEAIRLAPTHALAHSNLGLALMEQGKLDEAARQFETALSLDPSRQDTRRALANLKQAAGRTGPARQ
ncbi:MAG TPA: tetratricopeptide repeat protein [Candidatus Methylomirabilis sp.]|nr:tetratricopeptide repeat protein [Candidatus Methylomirabilis sp.]